MFGITDYSKAIIDYSNFNPQDLGRAAGFGGAMVLIGMVTVFSVLCILWGCLVLFKIFFHDLPEKKARAAADIPVEQSTVESAPAPTVAENEIIAVIAAAIAMAESESNDTKFRVVSFKRK